MPESWVNEKRREGRRREKKKRSAIERCCKEKGLRKEESGWDGNDTHNSAEFDARSDN